MIFCNGLVKFKGWQNHNRFCSAINVWPEFCQVHKQVKTWSPFHASA